MSSVYVPVHLRKRQNPRGYSHSSHAPLSFEDQFPDASFLTAGASNTDKNSQDDADGNYIGVTNNVIEVPKEPSTLPDGWVLLTSNTYKISDGRRICSNAGDMPIWETRSMDERYQQGMEYMNYIQRDAETFAEEYIADHGYSEYERLYRPRCNEELDDECEDNIDQLYSESDEEDDY